jgi:hypothetical protein
MVQEALSSAAYRTLDTGFFKELLQATGLGWDKVPLSVRNDFDYIYISLRVPGDDDLPYAH